METNKGIESLRAAVLQDCNEGQGCFNENGCNNEFHRAVPEENPILIEMGVTTKCIRVSKCFHRYCDKYKWVLDRAKHYSELTRNPVEKVIEAWENNRTYWYMNYYQECNQPLLENNAVLFYDDWVKILNERFGTPANWAFKCPNCGHIQTVNDFVINGFPQDAVTTNCIGRYKKDDGGCDWTLGGLLKIHNQSVLKDGIVFPVFEMATLEEAAQWKK